MIQLQDICKRHSNKGESAFALDHINLTIDRGELVTVMGPSGSGKSTLLSIIGLLTNSTEGTLAVNGHDAGRLPEKEKTRLRAEKFGFVFQFPSLVNTLDVRENVLLPKLFSGKVTQEDHARAALLLAQMGLQDKADRRSFELSGGEQRRVAMARALINDPDVILADEPTGALDVETAKRIMDLFLECNKAGKTILIVTHDPAYETYGHRTIHLHMGRIQG